MNDKLFILDPLSVIIKLAIISNKPIGTKFYINNNILYIHEPWIFQGINRYILNTNKNNLQLLYNPILLACKIYLSTNFKKDTHNIIKLFECSKKGIINLIKTYSNSSIIIMCLNLYYTIIDNYINEIYTVYFRDDDMTSLYTDDIINKYKNKWTENNIKIVIDLIIFLTNDNLALENVKTLEIFISNFENNIT